MGNRVASDSFAAYLRVPLTCFQNCLVATSVQASTQRARAARCALGRAMSHKLRANKQSPA
eukprot:9052069-Alexandrium_andersonii.AAC.1